MAAEPLVEAKFETSKRLADALVSNGAPLLAAYWDFDEDIDRWTLMLVPTSLSDQRRLIEQATALLVKPPYREIFSLSDPAIDGHQIDRARALAAHIRNKPFVGRRIDTTITGGQFFESAIPVYFKPELMTHLPVAS